jgi:ABC-2 type transport system ATP-binding protein
MRRILLALSLLLAGVTAATPAPAGAQTCPSGTPEEVTVAEERVPSTDGIEVAITVFRPAGVCAEAPTPVVLHGHGWGGSRIKAVNDEARLFLDAGYGLVSIDARGHGDTTGQAQLMHRDAEVHDYRAVLDWIHDHLDWVQRDDSGIDKDIVAGSYGASYGGGWQLMTAAFDDRLDALVPVVTWNDLAESLAPNTVPRTGWISLLYGSGEANVDLDPRVREWHAEIQLTGEIPDAAREHVAGSSPGSFIDQIDAPTLIVQGVPDTLFNLNEAVRNYEGLREGGVDVRLLGINTGHVFPALQPTGINAPDRDSVDVCLDDVEAHVRDFLDTHLRGDAQAAARVAAVPRVGLSTEQGGCATGADWPIHEREVEVELPGLFAPEPAGSLLLPLFEAEEDLVVAGIPTLTGTVPSPLDDRFFVSLVLRRGDGGQIVDDQVMPVRTTLAGDDGTLTVDLAGVATEMAAGDQLLLRVDGANEQFALATSRRPGAALLADVTVAIPVQGGATAPVSDDESGEGGAEEEEAEEGGEADSDGAGSPQPAGDLPVTGGGVPAAALALLVLAGAARGLSRA